MSKNITSLYIAVQKIIGELHHSLDSALFWNLMKVRISIGLKICNSVRHVSNVTLEK